jgi:Asp-tRNA(Asn)/Glu-tRNA(Gln) amidotransferase A subunit family amidase
MLSADDYRKHDAVALAELIRSKQIAPGEAVEAAIAAIERINPKINAVTVPMFAQGRDAAREANGQLAGVPFLLKDFLAQYKGVPTSAGTKIFANDPAPLDSELVARYRRAGLAIIGKTNSSEFAIAASSEPRQFGATRNPWDDARSTGGSSGGSAAAVAARMVPAAHATDGGGSIRIPASACGIFGLKPSRGRISMAPGGEGLAGAANEHAVSISVRDSAALLDATAGLVLGDPYTAPPPHRPFLQEIGQPTGRLRIAASAEPPGGGNVAPECAAAFDAAAKLLGELGHTVEQAAPQGDWPALDAAFFAIMAVQTRLVMELRAAGRPFGAEDFEGVTWNMAERGRGYSGLDYLRAVQTFHRTARALAPFFQTYDAFLTPTLAQLPPKLGAIDTVMTDSEEFLRRTFAFAPFTKLFNATGQPAMSVPLHWTEGNLPVGVQIVGRYGDEALLLRLAAQLETARPWGHRLPPLHA